MPAINIIQISGAEFKYRRRGDSSAERNTHTVVAIRSNTTPINHVNELGGASPTIPTSDGPDNHEACGLISNDITCNARLRPIAGSLVDTK
jgi:hypothetical protein